MLPSLPKDDASEIQILIIDRDAEYISSLTRMIKEWLGYETLGLTMPGDAIERACDGGIDVAVMGLDLPPDGTKTGLDLIRDLKRVDLTLCVIVTSMQRDAFLYRRVLELGGFCYVDRNSSVEMMASVVLEGVFWRGNVQRLAPLAETPPPSPKLVAKQLAEAHKAIQACITAFPEQGPSSEELEPIRVLLGVAAATAREKAGRSSALARLTEMFDTILQDVCAKGVRRLDLCVINDMVRRTLENCATSGVVYECESLSKLCK